MYLTSPPFIDKVAEFLDIKPHEEMVVSGYDYKTTHKFSADLASFTHIGRPIANYLTRAKTLVSTPTIGSAADRTLNTPRALTDVEAPLENHLWVIVAVSSEDLPRLATALHHWMTQKENFAYQTPFCIKASHAWGVRGYGTNGAIQREIKKNIFKDPLERSFEEATDGPINQRPDGRELIFYIPKKSPEECKNTLFGLWRFLQNFPEFGYCQSSDQRHLRPIMIQLKDSWIHSPFQIMEISFESIYEPLLSLTYEELLMQGVLPSELEHLAKRRIQYEHDRLSKFLPRMGHITRGASSIGVADILPARPEPQDFYPDIKQGWEGLLISWIQDGTNKNLLDQLKTYREITRLPDSDALEFIANEMPFAFNASLSHLIKENTLRDNSIFIRFLVKTVCLLTSPSLMTSADFSAIQSAFIEIYQDKISSILLTNCELEQLSALAAFKSGRLPLSGTITDEGKAALIRCQTIQGWIRYRDTQAFAFPARTQFLICLFKMAIEAHQQYQKLKTEPEKIFHSTYQYVLNATLSSKVSMATRLTYQTLGRLPWINKTWHLPIKAKKSDCFLEMHRELALLNPNNPDWYTKAHEIILNQDKKHFSVSQYARFKKDSSPKSALVMQKILAATTPASLHRPRLFLEDAPASDGTALERK